MSDHVLIVDDEPDIRLVARMALERLGGMRVTEAGSGDEAVAAVSAEVPDAVVLDVMMPGGDGPDTLARLRAVPGAADLPVVFLTAKVQPKEVAGLEASGVHGVLGKPFDPMTLADELRALLGWSRTTS